MKYIVVALLIVTTVSTIGFWFHRPIDGNDEEKVIREMISDTGHICDYQGNYGFIVSKIDRKYVENVAGLKYALLEKSELQSFMDANHLDYVFFGSIDIKHESKFSIITINNWPIPSNKFCGILMCGGSTSITIAKRYPSIFNVVLGQFVILDTIQIVS